MTARTKYITPFTKNQAGGYVMKGKVYRNSGQGAPFYVQFYEAGQRVFKRFWSYRDADVFLTGLNFESHHETLDVREWQKGDPIGFTTLSSRWLEIKKEEVKGYRNLRRNIEIASQFFGNKPVKRITTGDLQDYARALPQHFSSKTRQNTLRTLRSFFNWLYDREELDKIPRFPKITVHMKMRPIVDKETQQAIIEEVKRISWDINPKIWWGIQALATYVNVRPNELRLIKEGDIDHGNGVITLRTETTKEGKEKRIYLLEEDIQFIRSFPRSLPSLYFFRHQRRRGVWETKRYIVGRNYFYSWWKKACHNLGILSMDLYGGTRHSSVSALADNFTPSEIKAYGTGHTSQAFERYFHIAKEKRISLSQAARTPDVMLHKSEKQVSYIKGLKTGDK